MFGEVECDLTVDEVDLQLTRVVAMPSIGLEPTAPERSTDFKSIVFTNFTKTADAYFFVGYNLRL